MIEKTAKIRLRIRPPKRRSALDRLKARLYYRKNRIKIKVQRKRYLRTHQSTLKNRKLFQRFKPSWAKKPKKPHIKAPHKPKFKVSVPRHRSPKKFLMKAPHKD